MFPTIHDRPNLLAGEELPPAPRQERSRLKREALLDAGLALFAERGYEATTIEDVAERSGVAVGSFYQHFRSKRQLLLVLMDCLLDEVARMEIPMESIEDLDPRAALTETVRSSLSLDWRYAGIHRAWAEAITRDNDLAALNTAVEDWTASVATLLFGATQLLPGARRDLDVQTLAWLITMLFWKIAGRGAMERPSEAVVQGMTHILFHTFFEDGAFRPEVEG